MQDGLARIGNVLDVDLYFRYVYLMFEEGTIPGLFFIVGLA